MFGDGATCEPDEKNAARYDRVYDVYKDLYPNLVTLFPALDEALKT